MSKSQIPSIYDISVERILSDVKSCVKHILLTGYAIIIRGIGTPTC